MKTFFEHKSSEVAVGKLVIGANRPVPVQSMTNTNTLDTRATVEQVIRLADAGCDIVRITAPGVREAENLYSIKDQLLKKGVDLPIVADIHFTPKAAEVAARYVEKVRINPGNYVDRKRGKMEWSAEETTEARKRVADRLYPLIEICSQYQTAIRVGTNHGSLSERILYNFGNTPLGMVESAMQFVRVFRELDFHKLVLSMKASNFRDMTEANILLVERMIEEGFYYPIHLGVTEAGNGDEARIKSAAGIGSLLVRGIGDTVRVSLAEPPVNEVPVGKKIVQLYGRKPNSISETEKLFTTLQIADDKPLKELTGEKNPVVGNEGDGADLIHKDGKLLIRRNQKELRLGFEASPLCFNKLPRRSHLLFKRKYRIDNHEELIITSAVEFGLLFSQTKGGGIWIENEQAGKRITMNELSLKLLQGLGIRFSKAEFVACPSCGRTKYDLFGSFEKVKQQTAHLSGIKIAVMGCIVNGPGEMADADYGYVGAGPGKVTLYKDGQAVHKNIDENRSVDALIELIREGGDWIASK